MRLRTATRNEQAPSIGTELQSPALVVVRMRNRRSDGFAGVRAPQTHIAAGGERGQAASIGAEHSVEDLLGVDERRGYRLTIETIPDSGSSVPASGGNPAAIAAEFNPP